MKFKFFIVTLGILLEGLLCQAEYSFPTGLRTSDAKRIVEKFGLGFLGKAPPTLVRDENKSQFNFVWNWVETRELSKMGNASSDTPIQYPELYFSQELPYRVEVGVHSNLLMLNSSVSTFGGFARWTFKDISMGSLSFRAHGSSVDFRSLMGVNLYGGLLEADLFLNPFLITVGFGQLRTTATFEATVFGLTPPQPTVRTAHTYGHQFVRATYMTGRWNFSLESDHIREDHLGAILGYVF